MKKAVNVLFAATSDMIPFALTTALSIKDNLDKEYALNITYMYADIVKPISARVRNNYIEYSNYCYKNNNIDINYIDVEKYMYMFEGQNIGMWGEKISYTHYMYLLAPLILKDIDKIIYLDTDMIVNCDLSKTYAIDLGNYLLAMGTPRGQEEMGDDVSNSGFVFLNLKKWREENTLETILNFGKSLPKTNFCDQYLLHQYFAKNYSNRLLLLEKELNVFPQLFDKIAIDDMKILHFTGWNNISPWKDIKAEQRAGFLWWKYARQTPFYEMFLLTNIERILDKKTNVLSKITLSKIKKFLKSKIKKVDR